jgi:cytochrome c5
MSRISRAILGWVALLVVGSAYVQVRAASLPDRREAASRPLGAAVPRQSPAVTAATPSPQRALLDRYCVTCHNDRLKTAGLTLESIDVERVGEGARVWEKVVRKLRAGAMPPVGRSRPDPESAEALVSWLETKLDEAAFVNPDPGSVPAHRLNRAEYANAIRDLLAVEIDGASLLPADDADFGFDNIAGVLSVSPALLERYVAAARRISRLAIGDPTISPVFETYSLPKLMTQDSRMSEDLPFGSRGGLAVGHHFPVDGEYVVKVRLQGNLYDYIRGLGEPHHLDIRLDGALVKRFTVGGEDHGRPAPATFAGNVPGDPEWEAYLHHADEGLEVRFPAKAGTRLVGVSFVEKLWEREALPQPPPSGFPLAVDERWFDNPAIDHILVGGPYNVQGTGDTASRRRILTCRPTRAADEEPCARKILSTLARRAYRRPVSEADVRTLLGFYKAGRSGGGNAFERGIQRALQRILVDPEFVFRIERVPAGVTAGRPYRLGDVDLASRLSFFLWSSIPDDELLDVAARGTLSEPAVLERQVRRMLADSRSSALVDNFAIQWLNLRKLPGVTPNPDLFPQFDENLRQAFDQETRLFLESQLREDRSVVELLNADYTYVNERLAKHYQIPNVYGERFRRVTLADHQQRGGLLAHGSILTVTSYANRTSPVVRGKWLLDNILGSPPPPPPPDVPDLKENPRNGRPLALRERMEEHRKNPACSVCHVHIDPLGFALENFDAIGGWRTLSDAGTPIDTAGALPDGTRFDGYRELREYVLKHREEFTKTVIERLTTYAVGRGIEHYDLPAIRKIARDAASSQYRWSSIILGVVKSTPFQMRRAES